MFSNRNYRKPVRARGFVYASNSSTSKPRFVLFLLILIVACWGYFGLLPATTFGTFIKFGNVSQDNATLVKYVKEQVLIPPAQPPKVYDFSKFAEPINIENSAQHNQSLVIHEVFKQIGKTTDGFFVECLARDGVSLSSTLYLERNYNWTGLLIESHPKLFELIQSVNRKAWIANTCLSARSYPEMMDLNLDLSDDNADQSPNKNDTLQDQDSDRIIKVQCYPLYTFLLALEKVSIEYFSLEAGGDELAILQTIPFTKVKFLVLKIEVDYVLENKPWVKSFLESQGYLLYRHMYPDYIFIHESLKSSVTFDDSLDSGSGPSFYMYNAYKLSLIVGLTIYNL